MLLLRVFRAVFSLPLIRHQGSDTKLSIPSTFELQLKKALLRGERLYVVYVCDDTNFYPKTNPWGVRIKIEKVHLTLNSSLKKRKKKKYAHFSQRSARLWSREGLSIIIFTLSPCCVCTDRLQT